MIARCRQTPESLQVFCKLPGPGCCPVSSKETRLETGPICIQGQDWGGFNIARIRFPKGAIRVRYADGTEDVVRAGDVYFWPAGHTVIIEEDYESVEFSPAGPMGKLGL
jgi:hypothetical protein